MLSIAVTLIGIQLPCFWLHRAEADVIEKEAMGTRPPAHTKAETQLSRSNHLDVRGCGILRSFAPMPSGPPFRWMIIPLPSAFGSMMIRSVLHEVQRR